MALNVATIVAGFFRLHHRRRMDDLWWWVAKSEKKMVGEHILSNWSLMELVAGFLNLFIRVNRLGFEFSLSGLSLWWMVKGFGRGRGVAHGVRNQVTIKCLLCWKISSFCTRQESEWSNQICSSRNDPPLSNSLLYSEEANT